MCSYSLTLWKSALFGGKYSVMSWTEEDNHREESSWSTLLLQSSACYLPSFPSISLGLRDGLSSARRQGMVSLCGQHKKTCPAFAAAQHCGFSSPLGTSRVPHTAVRIAKLTRACETPSLGLKGVTWNRALTVCLAWLRNPDSLLLLLLVEGNIVV